jgi:hypothetical protein
LAERSTLYNLRYDRADQHHAGKRGCELAARLSILAEFSAVHALDRCTDNADLTRLGLELKSHKVVAAGSIDMP